MKITESQIEFWKENSFLVFKGLFKNEVQAISKEVDQVAAWSTDQSKWLKFYEMNDPSKLSRIENFCPFHPNLNGILTGDLMISIISTLMGEPAILYKDRINFKPAGGGTHAAHQDGVAYESAGQSNFDNSRSPYISMLISIDEADTSNGCLQMAKDWPISKLDILPMETPDPKHPNFSKITQKVEDSINWEYLETKPGDAIFFTERVPHRSDSNQSQKKRRILYGVYNPLSEGDLRTDYFDRKRLNMNDSRYMVGNPHAPS